MATDRTRRRTWTIAVAVTALLSVLYFSGGVVLGLRSAANLVVNPFSWTVNAVARPIGHLFAGIVNYSDVVAQNQRLRYQLGQAELRANEGWAIERQLQEITTQLHVPFVGSLPVVAAQVTATVQYICPVKGAREEMAKIDKTLVDNPLIFPDAEFLRTTHTSKLVDEATQATYTAAWVKVTGG